MLANKTFFKFYFAYIFSTIKFIKGVQFAIVCPLREKCITFFSLTSQILSSLEQHSSVSALSDSLLLWSYRVTALGLTRSFGVFLVCFGLTRSYKVFPGPNGYYWVLPLLTGSYKVFLLTSRGWRVFARLIDILTQKYFSLALVIAECWVNNKVSNFFTKDQNMVTLYPPPF